VRFAVIKSVSLDTNGEARQCVTVVSTVPARGAVQQRAIPDWRLRGACDTMALVANAIYEGPMDRSSIVAIRQSVELLEKNKPQQARAKRTYESILAAAAELLVEVGVERISTNLVAERAGITVPALYRYFPNKYAVLNALGAALMDKQNDVFQKWFDHYLALGDLQLLLDNVYELMRRTYDITYEQVGGLEVVQALRAVGPLQEVRLASHRLVAGQLAVIVGQMLGRPVDDLMTMQSRLTIDASYAIVEMALEDESLSTEVLLQEGARMMRLYWQGFMENAGDADHSSPTTSSA
tara:strand:- start:11566 stop:12450 length:885 start_codon:yes stop_codon:yes gene_type:complete